MVALKQRIFVGHLERASPNTAEFLRLNFIYTIYIVQVYYLAAKIL